MRGFVIQCGAKHNVPHREDKGKIAVVAIGVGRVINHMVQSMIIRANQDLIKYPAIAETYIGVRNAFKHLPDQLPKSYLSVPVSSYDGE